MAAVTTFSIPDTRHHARLDPQAVQDAGIVLCDLDGCLMSEGRLFAETADFVESCGARLRIVSNRSDSTAAALSVMKRVLIMKKELQSAEQGGGGDGEEG